MKNISTIHKQSGAVSLFIVIFAMLLMSVVTVGFLRIMTNDQNKATGNDLAQSAYDSSQAGVEDAKRALIWYSQNCLGSAPSLSCTDFVSNLDECNGTIRTAGVVNATDITSTGGNPGTGEIKVQQSTSTDASGNSTDKALDQAYTCVKIQLDTDDFVGSLTANQSVLVPLVSSDPFTDVVVEWYNRDDVTNATGAVDVVATGASQQLINNWPANRPPIMRTQFMQVGGSFRLSDFDTTNASSQSNANTVFLYPNRNGNPSATMTGHDTRKDASGASSADTAGMTPLPSLCQTSVSAGNYACRISLTLPEPVGGSRATAYLRLTSMYTGGHFRISLVGSKFRNVQPAVDSTGRANDVFRRVESRVDLYDTAFPYPDAAVDTRNNLCKDFGVTNDQYLAGGCTP